MAEQSETARKTNILSLLVQLKRLLLNQPNENENGSAFPPKTKLLSLPTELRLDIVNMVMEPCYDDNRRHPGWNMGQGRFQNPWPVLQLQISRRRRRSPADGTGHALRGFESAALLSLCKTLREDAITSVRYRQVKG